MLPLSTGRSPKIDKLYQTMRSVQISSYASDSQEERSIEYIRSISKQVLQGLKYKPNSNKQRDKLFSKTLRNPIGKHQETKHENLYDKYHNKNHQKREKLIEQRKAIIKTQMTKQTRQKDWKDPKYAKVQSKIQNNEQFAVKTLNYTKKCDIKANQEKKVKQETESIQNTIQSNQDYYQKYNPVNKKPLKTKQYHLYHSKSNLGVVERGQDMLKRKNISINFMKKQRQISEMDGITFSPERISKKYASIEKDTLLVRQQKIKERKLGKKKQMLIQIVKEQPHRPQLNHHPSAQSVIKCLWETPKKGKRQKLEQRIRQEEQIYEDRKTTNSKGGFSQNATNNTNSKVKVQRVEQICDIFS